MPLRAAASTTAILVVALLFIAADKPLTHAEQKERIAKLGDTYQQFLLDVAPIINDAEKETFLRLENDPQRDLFIDDFWRRRDKRRGTDRDSFRKDYYERLEVVKDKYEGTTSDRGRTYLVWGEPAQVVSLECNGALRPTEVWIYSMLPDYPELGRTPLLIFFQPSYSRVWKLWDPIADGMAALTGVDPVYRGPAPGTPLSACKDTEYLFAALKYVRERYDRLYRVWEPPKWDPEALSRVVRSIVIANPSAAKIDPKTVIAYPSTDGSKTDAQFVFYVPRAQVQANEVNNAKIYSIEVTGEVTRDGRMWETFRYSFDFPPENAGDTLPVVVDRMLKPGAYAARIKIADAKSGAEAIVERDLDVPEKPTLNAVQNEATARVEELKQNLLDDRATIRIVPLPDDDVVSGVQKIETILTGSLAKGVEFWLDGRKIAVRHAPPYQLDVDFGNVPKTHKVRVLAVDEHDRPIVGDEISVNTGTDPFRVRIASPRVAPHVAGPTRVAVDVRTPRGKKVKSVELYYNDVHTVTMTAPPFVQTINIDGNAIGYVRAVATLDDERTTEDAVILNSPAQMETMDVHLVELPTTVLSGGRPRLGLPQSAFRVYDESKRVDIAKFEEVKNLPLSVGVAVDNSASMEPRMKAAEKAAADFFTTVMRSGDKGFVVAFDSTPRVMQTWSRETTDLLRALAKMQARDQTALYDAIVYSLYNFTGVRGQRALVVVTDGKDTSSRFTYEQALEYAHRSGVPLYAIGIGVKDLDYSTRSNLSRLASETGGEAFFIGDVVDLDAAYHAIAEELRSQYIIGFYPPEKAGSKWHEVNVQVDGGRAKTIRGYYP